MLHLIERLLPRALHRLALRIAHRVRHRYRLLFRPAIAGVSVFVGDRAGRLLLVRHSYGSGAWSLPGGGMSHDEDPLDAARREMAEELGIDLVNVRLTEKLEETVSGAPHTAYLVAAQAAGKLRPDGREVIAARFFGSGEWPEPLSPLARKRIAVWQRDVR
ncbi:NUDIX hydrolase [Tsuneonella suprasediminis]|uniref:NUDIX hydrolase n=1 Tax=Tsuneonella suprasediminis TaxID=2306996 RepID=UPI001F0C00DF|nr:NUDIX domain-containing protein [Tsuneonella suprasediminis]